MSSDLVLGAVLGEGRCARVHVARWHGQDVCVKEAVRASASDVRVPRSVAPA